MMTSFDAVIHYQKLDGLEYGSETYKAKLDEIKPLTEAGWDKHCERNSHHPEYHQVNDNMSFLDIIEMVCDWKGANLTYNTSNQSFREAAEVCIERYDFNSAHRWLIRQLIDLLDEA